MDISAMTQEQLTELEAQIAERKAAQEREKKQQIDTYKELASGAVAEAFEKLQEQSFALAKAKGEVYALFGTVLDMKKELFKARKESQWSHTFTDRVGRKRITLGTNTLDNYDDTAEDGIAMVNEYLDSLAKDNPNAEKAVTICRSLMARDRKGNLKPSRIVTLYRHAKESGDARFIEGVEVIMNAYRPVASKTYVRAEYKNDRGQWVNLPLGMTEAE